MKLRALVLLVAVVAVGGARAGGDCTKTSLPLTPLSELHGRYHGFRGGLYPGGRDVPSKKYLAAGRGAARAVQPVDGKIVLLSIGMSNATQEFSAFKALADRDARKNANVTIVDGAIGGMDAERIKDPSSPYWPQVDQRVAAAGATGAQVQAVWLKEAIAGPTEPFPADAQRLEADLVQIVGDLAARFPNLKLVYLSSRTYAGYATTQLNPEPYAYQSAFAVRWTVARRIDGRLRGPWLGWGPYLWANGTTARKDGLQWTCDDVGPDGTHPSQSGRLKVAQLLLSFFTGDATARPWFTRAG